MLSKKKSILSLSKDELKSEVINLNLKPFIANQIWSWIYYRGVKTFSEMSNIKKENIKILEDKFSIDRPKTSKFLVSNDKTSKWLLEFEDGNKVETVHIPDAGRGSLCVSSQVGCTLNCKFCHTGKQRLVRNLEVEEIVGQLLVARDYLDDWQTEFSRKKTSNIVMMGMGEPLYNFKNVSKALKIIMNSDGINISKRRITLSTSGVVPMIEECKKELGVSLAISLHAVSNDVRDMIMPINKKYPIEELLEACRGYSDGNNRRITFEYVMLAGINDSDQDAMELVKLLKGIPAKVNLIPFNPWPGSVFECSSNNRIYSFAKIIKEAGYSSPIRKPRGADILAACGQLKSDSEKKRKAIITNDTSSN